MTDRRHGGRERSKKHQQEGRDRRSEHLRESWRRNHPSEEEEEKGRPGQGRRNRPA
jgi:hypothetical protein